jgi:hypothetical protein
MDIQTSPDPVARAREFGAEIAAAADEIERTRRIPEALLERLHGVERRFLGGEAEPSRVVSALLTVIRGGPSRAVRPRTQVPVDATGRASCHGR